MHRVYSWNKRWAGSLRGRFKVLIKRSRSVGHFCVSLFPLFSVYAAAPGDYSAACLAAALGVGGVEAAMAPAMGKGLRGWDEEVRSPGREAFIKLALSQHRAIIAEWITSSYPGSHAALVLSLFFSYLSLFPLPLSLLFYLPFYPFPFLFCLAYTILACYIFLSTSHFRYSLRAAISPSFFPCHVFQVARLSSFFCSIWRVSNLFHDLDGHPVSGGRNINEPNADITVTANRSSGAGVVSNRVPRSGMPSERVECFRSIYPWIRRRRQQWYSGAFNEYGPVKPWLSRLLITRCDLVVSIPRLFDDHFNPASLAIPLGHFCQPCRTCSTIVIYIPSGYAWISLPGFMVVVNYAGRKYWTQKRQRERERDNRRG